MKIISVEDRHVDFSLILSWSKLRSQASTKGVNVLCFINDEQIVTGDDLGVLAVWHVSGRRIGR